jgi:hypothetical protein
MRLYSDINFHLEGDNPFRAARFGCGRAARPFFPSVRFLY